MENKLTITLKSEYFQHSFGSFINLLAILEAKFLEISFLSLQCGPELSQQLNFHNLFRK